MVGAMDDTGLPQKMVHSFLGKSCNRQSLFVKTFSGHTACAYWFGAVLALLSNLLSNVPVIVMIDDSFSDGLSKETWIMTAWVCTVAGNLTMVGSAANLIVAHQAQKAGEFSFTSLEHG